MADIPKPEDIGDTIKNLKEMSGTLVELTTNLGHFFQQFEKLLPTSSKVSESASSLIKSFESLDNKTINLGSNFEHVTFDLLGAAEGFDKLGGAALSSASDLGEAAQGLNKHVENVMALAKKLTPDLFQNMGLGLFVDAVGKIGEHAVGSAERVQQLEKGFMALNIAGGDFNSVFDDNGRLVSDLDKKMVSFNERIQGITAATGMAPAEVTKSLAELSTVPNALYNNVNVAGEAMDSLTAISKVAAGSMQDTSTVIKDVSFDYQYLIGDTQKQIEYAANLASAQQSLKLPMADVRDAVQQVAQQYSMMSDNVDDTVKAMGLIVPAMEGVGLSGHQATKVFGDIMGAMSGLTDATESYISSTSGGAGGLQGVFAFEEKLANDKKGAAQDLMNTMKESVGGEIVTRAEAAADISGQAAAQYEKQRMMWEKITGRKMDKGEEAKIFEAMKEGKFEGQGLETPPAGQDALTKTALQGSAVQEKMMTSVTEIRNAVNAIATAQDIQLGITILNKDKKFFGEEEVKSMKNAQVAVAENKKGSEVSPDDVVKDRLTKAAEFGKDFATNLSEAWSNKAAAEAEGEKKVGEMQKDKVNTEHANDTAHQVNKEIRSTTPAASAIGPTAMAVRTAAETQQTTPPAPSQQPIAIAVTGEIKGMCIKCQQETMIDDVAAVALNKSNNQDVLKRSGPLRNG